MARAARNAARRSRGRRSVFSAPGWLNATEHLETCSSRVGTAAVSARTLSDLERARDIRHGRRHASPLSTRPYIHADMTLKERALGLTTPPRTKTSRYQASDALLAFLAAR